MTPDPSKAPNSRASFRLKEREINDLPEPSEQAQLVSEQLIKVIKAQIDNAGGQITFAEYMSLVLYAPGLGYYSGGNQKFGGGGDFITAPEISPLFSHCLARQCEQILQVINAAGQQAGDILEAGGGSGVMAAEVMAELERLACLPRCYMILELSAELRQRQQQTIKARVPHLMDRFEWLDALPAEKFCGVVLANELLDAMPVHRFLLASDDAREFYVAEEQGRLVWRTDKPSSEFLEQRIQALSENLPVDYVSEINLAAEAWVKTIADIVDRGLVLIVDYGFPCHEYYHEQRTQGTLMCHYRHRSHDDPFVYPGLQDITAHVDFTAVAQAAVDAGFHVAGYNTQGFFLMATGLTEMMAQLNPDDSSEYLRLSQQVKTLTLPSEMGELFKVMALSKNIDVPLMGFTLQDLRNRL